MPPTKVDHRNTICCICKSGQTLIIGLDFEGNPIPQWNRCPSSNKWCDKKQCDGYICNKCRRKIDNGIHYIETDKIVKNIRTGNLDKNSPLGKAVIDQAAVVKVLKIEDLNMEMDNFGWYIDAENKEHGKIDVKGPSLSILLRGGSKIYYWHIYTGRKIYCNTYICLGHSLDRKNIENVWVIPNEEDICDRLNIKIYKISRASKWDKFKVDPTSYNDAYHSLMEFLKDKRYFGTKDIKKWLDEGK